MKYSTIIKETNPDTGTRTFSNLSSKLSEKSKNIRPLNVPRDGMCKDRFQSFKILSSHRFLVPQYGTMRKVEFNGKVQPEVLFSSFDIRLNEVAVHEGFAVTPA